MSFTKFPNNLLEAVYSLDLSKTEIVIVLFLARRFYGFHKNSVELSLQDIENCTGIKRAHASTAINRLVELKMISVEKGVGTKPSNYRFLVLPQWEHYCYRHGNTTPSSLKKRLKKRRTIGTVFIFNPKKDQ